MNTLLEKNYSLLLALVASGCTINQDLLTAGEQESDGATGGADPTEVEPTGGPDSGDTDCGDTDCPEEFPPSACLAELAWNDGLIGLTHQRIDIDGLDASQTILARVDPDTHALTPFAEGYPRSNSVAMVIGADGAIYTGGHVGPLDHFEGSPQWLLKFSQEGALVWSTKPQSDGVPSSPATDLAVRGDELIVVSELGELGGRSTFNGALLWDLPRTDGARFHDIAVDAEGALHVTGNTQSGPGEMPVFTAFLRKYAVDGTLLWEAIPADDVGFQGFALDETGGLIAAISEFGPDLGVQRLRKYDATGAELWTRDMPGLDPHEYVGRFYTRPGGGMIAIGQSNDYDKQTGAITIAFGSEGQLLWVDRALHPELKEVRNNAAVIVDGTVMVSGCGRGAPNNDAQGWMLKFTP